MYFKLFANCIPVKGESESIIYDLQRNCLIKIPNEIFDILIELRTESIYSVKKKYNNEEDDGIDSFLNYFDEKELGFFTNMPNSFPLLNTEWYYPGRISNAIIEIDSSLKYDIFAILDELESLNCKAIQLRFLNSINLVLLEEITYYLSHSSIQFVEVFVNKNEDSDFLDRLQNININNKRFTSFIVFNSSNNNKTDIISFNKNYLGYESLKEQISSENFAINIKAFTEAVNYNLALNKKVCISFKGEIKNHLSHKKSYGSILTKTISETLLEGKIQEFWNISNDKIEICKNCLYRYCCVSNSELVFRNNKIFKKDICEILL